MYSGNSMNYAPQNIRRIFVFQGIQSISGNMLNLGNSGYCSDFGALKEIKELKISKRNLM